MIYETQVVDVEWSLTQKGKDTLPTSNFHFKDSSELIAEKIKHEEKKMSLNKEEQFEETIGR